MAQPKKAPRRLERIFAFKVLYGLCFVPVEGANALEQAFRQTPDKPENLSDQVRDTFAWELVHGVWKHRDALDALIGTKARNWRTDRMGKVEITLLRLALFELLHTPDVPPKVVINEAIELSKQFGDEKSRVFVNGILDASAKALESGELKRALP